MFFKVIFDRHVVEKRSTQEIFDELDRAHEAQHLHLGTAIPHPPANQPGGSHV
jgi:hypothetical protein